MRLMGKREIGQLQPFELAISIMIADLASTPMADAGIPITNGIIPILALLVMHLTISLLNIKSIKNFQNVAPICNEKLKCKNYKGCVAKSLLKLDRAVFMPYN